MLYFFIIVAAHLSFVIGCIHTPLLFIPWCVLNALLIFSEGNLQLLIAALIVSNGGLLLCY